MSHWSARSGVAFLAVAVLLAAGCNSGQESKPREQSHLKPLALLYGQYIGRHRGKPPADEAAFKEFVRENQAFLTPFNITDPESAFVSERDGKPYVVIYGTASGPPSLAGAPVIAHEQEGRNGRRFVASNLGAVEEVDEARFRELVPAGK